MVGSQCRWSLAVLRDRRSESRTLLPDSLLPSSLLIRVTPANVELLSNCTEEFLCSGNSGRIFRCVLNNCRLRRQVRAFGWRNCGIRKAFHHLLGLWSPSDNCCATLVPSKFTSVLKAVAVGMGAYVGLLPYFAVGYNPLSDFCPGE